MTSGLSLSLPSPHPTQTLTLLSLSRTELANEKSAVYWGLKKYVLILYGQVYFDPLFFFSSHVTYGKKLQQLK